MGDGESTVILLHGIGGYVENWADNITALAQAHRIYALDIVGFGRTDKPQVRFTVPYVTEFVHEFMIAQHIDRAALVGESMGGGIALKLAIQYPHQVEKLVLADTAGLGREVSLYLRLMSIPFLGELSSRPSRKWSAQFLALAWHDQNLITEQRIEECFEMASLPGAQRCFLSVLRCMINVWGPKSDAYRPIFDHLEEIEIPTLILWGAQDRILPVAHAHQAVQRFPNARLHIIDPCGHVPNIECAQEFNALVADFLSEKTPA
jgi:4,5:9,10-diseco-3-hydroxy-5,9,17-trioxoandrosta-1(10),2-diene-4-oate hydrolase